MTLVKKFGLGAVAAALFMAMAMATLANTAYADVDNVTVSDATILINQTVDVTANLDDDTAPVELNDDVTFNLSGSGEAEFDASDDSDLVCELVDIDLGDDGAAAGGDDSATFDCEGTDVVLDDADITVDVADEDHLDAAALDVELTGTGSGDIEIFAEHAGAEASVEADVFQAEAEGDVDAFDIDAPASAEADEELEVTVTALDEDGDEVEGEEINVEVEEGADSHASVTTDADGEAVFTFDVDDDATGVVLTFYTGAGVVFENVVETIAIPVAGDAESITIDAPESVEAGATAGISATVLDEDEDALVGEDIDFVVSAGSVVNCDEMTEDDGVAECTFVAPTDEQTVQLTVVSAGAVASTTIEVGDAPDDDDDDVPGEGEFEGEIAASGSSIVVFTGGSVQDLIDAAEALDQNVVSIFVTSGGEFIGIILGAPDFVNAEFAAEFSGGLEEQGVIVTTR